MKFYFINFLIYSMLGWFLEVIYSLFKRKKLINRGFLFGPICPIYGIGCSILIYLLKPIKNNILLFIMATILTSILEYLTSLILELIFNNSWWDYSENKYNIKGRICLRFSLIWGILAIFLIKEIHPYIKQLVKFICNYDYIYLLLFIIFGVDYCITICSLYSFSKIQQDIQELKNKYEIEKYNIKEKLNKESLKQDFLIKKQNLLNKLSNRHKQLIDIYPNIKSKKYKIIEDIKEYINKKNKSK